MATRRIKTRAASEPVSVPVADAVSRDSAVEERVRIHAYQLFERRQNTSIPGDALTDWLRAERYLTAIARQFQKPRIV
jgi:hypothetical protein